MVQPARTAAGARMAVSVCMVISQSNFYDAGDGETGLSLSPTILRSVGHPLPKRGPQCATESSSHARLRP